MTDQPESPANSVDDLKKAALDYHRFPPHGKIKVVATKPMVTQRDLALAYSPGVAYACEAIVADPNAASVAGSGITSSSWGANASAERPVMPVSPIVVT